jgi:HEAT repeat protein
MRAMLRDLLVRIGQKHLDELGAFITDSRWYLVRNIADILGRLRSPEGIPHLVRLVRHWEPRVRTQALDALVSIGTESSQATISAFLDDREEKIRLRALKSLDHRGLPMAMPALQALVEGREPLNRSFVLRQAGIETAARLGARDALPALGRLARKRFVFNKHSRELRRLARMAQATIQGVPATDQAGRKAS